MTVHHPILRSAAITPLEDLSTATFERTLGADVVDGRLARSRNRSRALQVYQDTQALCAADDRPPRYILTVEANRLRRRV